MIRANHACTTIEREWTPDTSHEFGFPNWNCPACEDATLRIVTASSHMTSHIAFEIHEGIIPHWDDYGIFTALLRCQQCQRDVAVLGDYSLSTPDGIGLVIGQGIDGRIVRQLTIKAVNPPINLISIPPNTTTEIKQAVQRSFALYWLDSQACAGAIRIAIERAADHLASRRLDTNGRPVSLGVHLQDLEQTAHRRHAEAFRRIVQTLGNAGAHGDPVSYERLLIAFELLEIELGSMFEGSRRTELMDQLQRPPRQ